MELQLGNPTDITVPNVASLQCAVRATKAGQILPGSKHRIPILFHIHTCGALRVRWPLTLKLLPDSILSCKPMRALLKIPLEVLAFPFVWATSCLTGCTRSHSMPCPGSNPAPCRTNSETCRKSNGQPRKTEKRREARLHREVRETEVHNGCVCCISRSSASRPVSDAVHSWTTAELSSVVPVSRRSSMTLVSQDFDRATEKEVAFTMLEELDYATSLYGSIRSDLTLPRYRDQI